MEKMKVEKWSAKDITDELADEPEVLKYLQILPKGLWSRHFEKLEQMREEKPTVIDEVPLKERQINYLLGIIHAREDAIEECSTNDEYFRGKFSTKESAHAFGDNLRTLLVTNGNLLGAGQTARVKSLAIEGLEKKVAVKYLLTPTAKTLSANAEYDMLNEVRTELEIEEVQGRHGAGDSIRVPHPLFFYKRGKLQCYGMDEIDGMTLEEFLDTKKYKNGRDEIASALRSKYSSEQAKTALLAETDAFMQDVHAVCLHGDIKLANMMVDRSGKLYLIDFGQSISLRTMEENTHDQFENLMDNEREQIRGCLQHMFKQLKGHTLKEVA